MLLSGCVPVPAPVIDMNDGFTHIATGGTFECGGHPVAVDGSHKDVVLKAGCPRLRVNGSFNDVIVYVESGATIEVTGIRNRVIYRLTRRGTPPRWYDSGTSNELLRTSRASWEQDHDWYEELH